MSEVLITLGIIGVIASIVMPTVVGKVNDHVRKTQFKRAYTLLASAVQKLEEDKGYIQCNYGANNSWADCRTFIKEVAEYLKPIKYCPNKPLENGCLPSYADPKTVYVENRPNTTDEFYNRECGAFNSNSVENWTFAYVLTDGIILFAFANNNGNTNAPFFIVDINGFKAPNKWGHDVFFFDLYRRSSTSGLQVRPATHSCAPVEKGGKNARDFFTSI